ncbi:peptidoglycan-N-acetylmuramic acid deacetylase [Desulfohalotomaculum tongense]|uniref:delta-lactam-biosynthetic de-N-acetylase n=1 Tax=Desulforadius tongensis TaxID=1216062 RepID=UPI00195A1623|nr:delta-lactam-biosynthetic de-N-acetylase [Desulforadius tongensis]MBM7856073.1 peptidoglycan-N-acetylmuramic acid deacetylase [Desulforadius tongensis]
MKKLMFLLCIPLLAVLTLINQGLLLDNNTIPKSEGKNTASQEIVEKEKTAGQLNNSPEKELPKETAAEKPVNSTGEKNIKDDYSQYDNTCHGWGFSRNSQHQPPAVGWVGPVITKYGGMYIGNTDKKEIYLTFDSGYENGYTNQILDTLKANNVKAHFFITAPYVKDHPEIVRRIVEEGHVLGNHSVTHPSLPSLTAEQVKQEILGVESQVKELINYDMYLFRPPRGEWSERTLKITEDLGYKTVFWSMAYRDWLVDEQQGWQRAYNHVMANIHNGAVILLHSVSSDNAQALDKIIKDLKAQGYQFGIIKPLEQAE